MQRLCLLLLALMIITASCTNNNTPAAAAKDTTTATADTLVLSDITWTGDNNAGSQELNIPSAGSMLQGFIYKAGGSGKHPTLLLLHGYPGNERNLDLAQVVRARGWNVVYFDYRGSWASQGTFSFKNCVEDVVNVAAFFRKYADSFHVDTSNMALFGHSMGGWVCLKALQQIPGIKKGFALSTWNIPATLKYFKGNYDSIRIQNGDYFVLNATVQQQFEPVAKDTIFYDLAKDGKALADKQIVMLDEHHHNEAIAAAIKADNKAYFSYDVWQTDHPFTNKRIALIKKVLEFLGGSFTEQ